MLSNTHRLKMTDTFRTVCEQYAPWRQLAPEKSSQIIRRMERNCFEISIEECKREGIDRIFSEPRFLNRYSSICFKLLSNLDVNSSVNSTYIIDKLIDETADPYVIAELTSEQLCPAASEQERAMIKSQQNQTITLKVSRAYTCPKCGEHETLPLRYQGRSADEECSFSIKCVNCGWTWRR